MQHLDEAMKKSTARWKIVVGHHTMRSVSEHGDTEELLKLLLQVLKVTFQKLPQLVSTFRKVHNNPQFFCEIFLTIQDNGVDFYINGHDHCLEHISSRDRYRDEFK